MEFAHKRLSKEAANALVAYLYLLIDEIQFSHWESSNEDDVDTNDPDPFVDDEMPF